MGHHLFPCEPSVISHELLERNFTGLNRLALAFLFIYFNMSIILVYGIIYSSLLSYQRKGTNLHIQPTKHAQFWKQIQR